MPRFSPASGLHGKSKFLAIRTLLLLLTFLPCLHAEDFRPQVLEALMRGEKRIVIPPGVYRLDQKSGGEMWKLSDVKDVEIVADGVTLE